jgi:hypothetical protein
MKKNVISFFLPLFIIIAWSMPVMAEPCGIFSVKDDLCKCEIRDLHPTQFAVGMREVERKAGKIHDLKKDKDKLKKFKRENPEPTVIGPGGELFIIDHHHLARALADENVKKTSCKIVENFSNLGKRDFWKKMKSTSWVYLYDQKGQGPRSPLDLPVTVKGLRDDPYRSLAGAVRRAGGYEKTSKPFAEFKWAQFFRSRISIRGRSDDHFNEAVEEAIELAMSREARGLPGYIGE